MDRNVIHFDNHELLTYTVSADRKYSIFFEVFTTAGAVNVSYATFSKIAHAFNHITAHFLNYSNL